MSLTFPSPTPPVVSTPLRFLRFPAIRACTGLSRSTIWRLERRGDFPRHRRISRNAVAWVKGEVLAWMRAKAAPQPCWRGTRPGTAGRS